MLDDLRKSTQGQSYELENEELSLNTEAQDNEENEHRFLGMTAVERMFITIFLFLAVCVIGAALLLATGRLVL